MEPNSLLQDVRDTNFFPRYKTELKRPNPWFTGKPVLWLMSVGKKAPAEATVNNAGAGQPKPSPRGGARFERLLSGLGTGPLVDAEPDKVKEEIRRWAKKVATLVRQLSFGAWPEKSDGSSEHHGASDDTSAG
ncbi:hypothetical protein ACP70R_038153 [Stipagrostis hirtigluma subsp. patula]